MNREHCKDCVCLCENKAGEWFCDEKSQPISEVSICPEENDEQEFNIIIEETVSEEFQIKAKSIEEALEKAREQYIDGDLVLEPGELQSCKAIHLETDKEIKIY